LFVVTLLKEMMMMVLNFDHTEKEEQTRFSTIPLSTKASFVITQTNTMNEWMDGWIVNEWI